MVKGIQRGAGPLVVKGPGGPFLAMVPEWQLSDSMSTRTPAAKPASSR